jgi:soluble lytic murein transglycosylase-like protein
MLVVEYGATRADRGCVRRISRVLWLALASSAMAIVCTACGGGHTSTPTGPSPAPPTPVVSAGGGRIVPLVRAGGGRIAPHAVATPVALPVSSPWSLPPLMLVRSRPGGGNRARLGRQVLRSPNLALAPAARAAVSRRRVDPGLLRLLLRARPTGAPLLVFAASGRDARVQETTLWMTRRVLRGFQALAGPSRPARLLLTPVPGTKADLAGPPRPKAGALPSLVALYRAAGYRYGVDWRILAAINRVETNFGSNTHTSSAGAVGWMQFLPSTWRRWGVDASGDGVADPMNPADAIYSAARYLRAAGIQRDVRRAIWAYNPLASYVNQVLSIAAAFPADYGESAGRTTG